MRSNAFLAAALIVVSTAATAQFKCTNAAGSVSFQEKPCTEGDRGERLPLTRVPETDARPVEIRKAIAAGKVVLGMTRGELDRVMGGPPTRTNPSIYASGRHDQLIYEQPDRTVYVYTQNGIVTAVQITERPQVAPAQAPAPVAKACPSSREIWDLEVERSKSENRGNDRLLTELTRQIGEARACKH